MRDPRKIKLIEAVQALWDAPLAQAEKEATAAIRSGDKEKTQYARDAVLRADVTKAVADRVIILIEQHWPQPD